MDDGTMIECTPSYRRADRKPCRSWYIRIFWYAIRTLVGYNTFDIGPDVNAARSQTSRSPLKSRIGLDQFLTRLDNYIYRVALDL